MRDSDDVACNRCKSKGKECGNSRLPGDDINHRIPKRVSVACQTEPESSELLRSANSAVQHEVRRGLSSPPSATMAPEFTAWRDMRELGDFSHGLFGMDDGRLHVSGDYLGGIDPNFLLEDAEVDWPSFADNVRTPHPPQTSHV